MSKSIDNRIKPEQRVALIKAQACFSMLSKDEARELALCMKEKVYRAKEIIVAEHEWVDSVYIIAAGRAEVAHEGEDNKKKIVQIPISTIHPGESIGLNDTGFFSTTGKRTATVTALSDVLALSLSIQDLHTFFERYPHIQSAMYSSAELMLRIKVIKQSLPFHKLSHARLMKLANQVEELCVPAGKDIFTQGEEGDCCYLIRSGQVEIVSTDEQGNEQRLALLSSPTLFGEATLITRSPRNATARALENCDLFMLRHSHLSELIETEENVADMFMTLMMDRSKPLQNPRITAHHRNTADGESIVILKNPVNCQYFKLSSQGYFIWHQLNGKHTMQDITLSVADQFNVFAPDVVAALISKLSKAGFVENVIWETHSQISTQPLWVRSMLRLRQILESRVALGDADKWLTKLYNHGARLLFTPIGQAVLAVLAFFGMGAFGFAIPHTIHLFKTIPNSWLLLLLIIPFTVLSTILHELGHALATKAYGYEVHYMGVGWYWFGPVAFTDTSDMWLSTRWPRIVVNLAGIYADILNAGIASLLIYLVPNVYVQAILWLFALFTYINAFRMLSPLQELDGYYVLMDLLEKPNLRQSAVLWLLKGFPKAMREPKLFLQNKAEVCYWLASLAFLVLVTLATFLLQSVIFKIVGIQSTNPFVSIALPFFIVIVSSLSIIADLRNQT